VSGRLSETTAWRRRPSRPGFPLPFGRRRSLLGHPVPAEELGPPRGRLTGPRPGPRRGYRVPHARAATGVGAPYTPRTAVLIPTEARAQPAPAALPRPVPAPHLNLPPAGIALRGINEGSHDSPVRSSPRLRPPGWSGPPLGLSPGFAPRRPGAGRRTPRRGQAIEHGPGTTLYDISRTSNPACSLVSCDLASHRALR
jgi:hypothetical protein